MDDKRCRDSLWDKVVRAETMNLIDTIILSAVMMAGLFLMLWSAVGFIQDKGR